MRCEIKSRLRRIMMIAAMMLMSSLLVGCGSESPAEPAAMQDVTLKLKWVHQAQFAGNYVAKEKGMYDAEGVNLNIEPFSFDDTTIDSVVSGHADFGITGADELLLARAAGKPIKAFAVIYKINPVCAYALAESGIEKPQDFIFNNWHLRFMILGPTGLRSLWLLNFLIRKRYEDIGECTFKELVTSLRTSQFN